MLFSTSATRRLTAITLSGLSEQVERRRERTMRRSRNVRRQRKQARRRAINAGRQSSQPEQSARAGRGRAAGAQLSDCARADISQSCWSDSHSASTLRCISATTDSSPLVVMWWETKKGAHAKADHAGHIPIRRSLRWLRVTACVKPSASSSSLHLQSADVLQKLRCPVELSGLRLTGTVAKTVISEHGE